MSGAPFQQTIDVTELTAEQGPLSAVACCAALKMLLDLLTTAHITTLLAVSPETRVKRGCLECIR